MASKIGGWLLYFAGVAAIIYVGWNQPLHYRFLTPQQIREIENPSLAPAPAATGTSEYTPSSSPSSPAAIVGNPTWRTSLDKGVH